MKTTLTPIEKAAAEFRKATKLWQILALAMADLRKVERRNLKRAKL